MKKKFSLIFVSVLAMFLVACGNSSNSGATSYDNSNSSSEAEATPTVTSEPTFTPTPTLTPTPTPEPDPLAMLEVTEEWALENQGFYLKRNGKIYSLGKIPRGNAEMYNIGHTYAGARNNEPVGLYFQFWENNLSNSVGGKIASAGDVPVVTFMDGDELISVDRTRVNFAPATFQCYSFRYIDYNPDPRENHSGDLAIYQDLSDPIILKERECSFTTDWFEEMNYEHGKEYTISWFEGTRYYEISRVADSAHYTISYSSGKGYEGKRNKGGYAEYDLAVIRKELTPGLYSLNENIIVEIK